MKSKTYVVELFIDNLIMGNIILSIGNPDAIKQAIDGWLKLRATSPESNEFSDMTETIYSNVLNWRIRTIPITGKFEEKDLESQVISLQGELKTRTEERDACVAELAKVQVDSSTTKKDFVAHA